jgi:hypothetical protein
VRFLGGCIVVKKTVGVLMIFGPILVFLVHELGWVDVGIMLILIFAISVWALMAFILIEAGEEERGKK